MTAVRWTEVTPGDATVPPGNRQFRLSGKRRAARLAGYGIGWLAVVALERLVAAAEVAA